MILAGQAIRVEEETMTLDDEDARLADLAGTDDEDAHVAIDALLDHWLTLTRA